jgi:hypothetical protein
MSIESEVEILRNANVDLQNRLREAEGQIKTLMGYFNGAATEIRFVSLTSGGAVTSPINIVNGVIKV